MAKWRDSPALRRGPTTEYSLTDMADPTKKKVDVPPADAGLLAREAPSTRSFLRELLASLLRFKDGDFTARMASDFTGIDGKIADVFNEILRVSERRAGEISRVCRVSARRASSSSA